MGSWGFVIGYISIFLVFTGLLEAIGGLRQLYGFENSQHHLFKMTGSFFNPGPYAGYLAMIFPLALHLFLHYHRRDGNHRTDGTCPVSTNRVVTNRYITFIHRICTFNRIFTNRYIALIYRIFTLNRILMIFGGITCIAILLVLPAAMSRASWVAVAVGTVVVIFMHYAGTWSLKDKYLRYKKQVWLAGSVLVLFLLIASAGMYFLKKDSADGRLLTWKVSAHAIAEHPFGVGLGNFSHAYGEAQAAYFAGGRATETEEHVAGVPEYGFNEYLQIAIEAGIPSLLLFLTVLVFAFIQVARTREWGVMGALASLLVFALFSYPFSVLPFLLVFVFLLSVGGKTQKNEATQITQTTQATEIAETTPIAPLTKITKIAEKTKQLYPLFVVIPCFLLVCFCLYRQYPVYEAYKQWNTCRLYYHNGMYKQASIQYEQFYPYLNDQIKFLFEYAQSLSHTGHYQQSNVVLERAIQISCDPMLYNIMGKNCQSMKEYVQAEKYFIHATHLVPNRLYPWYLLTKLYDEMGLPAKACAAAYIVQTKEPKVQSQAIKQMRKEVKKYCK